MTSCLAIFNWWYPSWWQRWRRRLLMLLLQFPGPMDWPVRDGVCMCVIPDPVRDMARNKTIFSSYGNLIGRIMSPAGGFLTCWRIVNFLWSVNWRFRCPFHTTHPCPIGRLKCRWNKSLNQNERLKQHVDCWKTDLRLIYVAFFFFWDPSGRVKVLWH